MRKNHVKYNVLMTLVILFAICYQSIHIFTDEAHQHHSHEIIHKNTSKTEFLQNNHQECPVCDFEFAAFLSTDIFTFDFINPQHKFHFSNSYESIVKEKEFVCFSHRGPPIV